MRPRNHAKEREEDDVRFTTSLAGLAVALLLVLVGFYLLQALFDQSKLEDCLFQGRMNCEPIEAAAD